MEKKVYLDNAATTFVSGEVLNEMVPCFNDVFGNPSSVHSFGREAMALVDLARDRISSGINAKKSNEIYFTAGGTEANNWAIKGLARANAEKGKHIIVSKIEHESILESCKALEKEGFEITYLNVDSTGLVSIADLLHYIRKDTILVSVMAVNNEIGTIQNLKTIANISHENGAVFHTDAVQALGAINLNVQEMDIDAMSMSAHKIYGPKGVGALYVKEGIKIEDFMDGGNQERNKRGGTLNVPAIVGFGKAVEIAVRDLEANQRKITSIKNYFLEKVKELILDVSINGETSQKVPGILNLSFNAVEGESVLMLLDMEGIAVSTGSACSSGSLEPSHVLKAMGVSDIDAQSAVRFSFGKNLSKEDIDYVVEKLSKIVFDLRRISPLNVRKAKMKKD